MHACHCCACTAKKMHITKNVLHWETKGLPKPSAGARKKSTKHPELLVFLYLGTNVKYIIMIKFQYTLFWIGHICEPLSFIDTFLKVCFNLISTILPFFETRYETI